MSIADRESTTAEAGSDGQPPSLGVVAGIFYIIGLAMVAFGFVTMYYYDSYSGWGRLVGADAYNYVIIAVRGVGWIVAGAAAVVIGATCSVVATIRGTGRVAPLVAIALSLAGCVSVSPEAARVAVIEDPGAVNGCTSLGPVARSDRLWGATPQAWTNNRNVLRADTAALGGDTLLIRQERLTVGDGPRTIGETYRCQR